MIKPGIRYNFLSGVVTLTTGRSINAHQGFIAINLKGEIAVGYDQRGPHDMTKDERIQLADHMIRLWQQFRDSETPTMD